MGKLVKSAIGLALAAACLFYAANQPVAAFCFLIAALIFLFGV